MPTDEEFLTGNVSVIDEFRAKGGVVPRLGFPILLLTTTGARSGRPRTSPLGFGVDGDQVFIVGSKGGAPSHPAWFHNLRANPSVRVELGGNVYAARAIVADGKERDRLFEILKADAPSLEVYERKSPRVIPVIVLEGVPAPTTDR